MAQTLAQAQETLEWQVTIGLLWECWMQGNKPGYNQRSGGNVTCTPYPPPPNAGDRGGLMDFGTHPMTVQLWEPNNRLRGVVRGWTVEQILQDWAIVHANERGGTPNIFQYIDRVFGNGSGLALDPITRQPVPSVALMGVGLYIPNRNAGASPWPTFQQASPVGRKLGLATWLIYRMGEDARAVQAAEVTRLRRQAAVGGGLEAVQAAQRTAAVAAASAVSSAKAAAFDELQRVGAATDGYGTAADLSAAQQVSAARAARTGAGINPYRVGGTSGRTVKDQLQEALGRRPDEFEVPTTDDLFEDTDPGTDQPPAQDDPAEPTLPDQPSTAWGLEQTSRLGQRILGNPGETARRLILEQSKADLEEGLRQGALAADWWWEAMADVWSAEMRDAMGPLYVGGEVALVATLEAGGASSTDYMRWFSAVQDAVRAQLGGGAKKSGGGGGGVVIGLFVGAGIIGAAASARK